MTQVELFVNGKDASQKWWWFALLGAVLVLGGAFMLGHLMIATIVSAIFVGAAILVGGAFLVVHAFSMRGWGGFLLYLLLGLLYAAFGAFVLANPVAASVALTLVLAAMLIASGVIRIVMALRHWQRWGWLLILSGLVAILAGLIIFAGWPWSGLWVLGLLLGIDFIFHGVGWLIFAFALRPRA